MLPLVLAGAAATGAALGQEWQVKVEFGGNTVQGPIYWPSPVPLQPNAVHLGSDSAGNAVVAQADDQNRLWWWPAGGRSGGEETYRITERGISHTAGAGSARPGVLVEPQGDDRISVMLDGQPFTTFHFKKNEPKPYLYPVIGPTGAPVTRDFPMKDTGEERKNKRQDHPHQRSVWTAHGDVRLGKAEKGTDYWSEGSGRGVQRVVSTRTASGPVFGQIEAQVDWLDASGQRQLRDTRTYTFFRADDGLRMIDYKLVLHFPEGDVTFGDTKEAGLLSVRLTPSMDELGGGRMVNSNGQTGMNECWGQPAEWCDYYGPVAGRTVGLAIFDHPGNFQHPTRWHIRDYGLYTTNPFALRAFNVKKDGAPTFKKGESMVFNYRMVIHQGDTQEARVPEQYRLYAGPPAVSVQN